MADIVAAASKSREATRVGWEVVAHSDRGGTEEAWAGTDGEIGGRPW